MLQIDLMNECRIVFKNDVIFESSNASMIKIKQVVSIKARIEATIEARIEEVLVQIVDRL